MFEKYDSETEFLIFVSSFDVSFMLFINTIFAKTLFVSFPKAIALEKQYIFSKKGLKIIWYYRVTVA